MAVAVTVTHQNLPYGGLVEPGLPQGIWRATAVVAGDGTGGLMTATIRFQLQGAPLSALFYSLEYMSIALSSVAATRTAHLNCNMGWLQRASTTTSAFNLDRRILILQLGDGNGSVDPDVLESLRGTFLGSPLGGAVDDRMRLSLSNTDTEDLTWMCLGYFWSQQALMAPGGIRRQPQGIFDR